MAVIPLRGEKQNKRAEKGVKRGENGVIAGVMPLLTSPDQQGSPALTNTLAIQLLFSFLFPPSTPRKHVNIFCEQGLEIGEE